ncbi:ubiquitin-conjugating enzyme E2 G2 [Pseudogymnoascus sp. 24MN13]|nr:ubiquitin-conjugating enzyme E2 G2 [Pseudogymnoascus sp. 24MN13]
MATSTAHRRLLGEYRALTNNPPEGITAGPVSEDDLLHWEALIQGPEGTPFEGGVFPAELKFPKDYPLAPPSMKFIGEVWHPNVYPSGLVCISILHPPGDDPNHYEHASERWSPIQSVEKILISVMGRLAEPTTKALRMWRLQSSGGSIGQSTSRGLEMGAGGCWVCEISFTIRRGSEDG